MGRMKHQDRDIMVMDRRTRTPVRETVLGDRLLRLAYERQGTGLLRAILFRTGWLTRLLGWYADSRASKRRIATTVRDLGIDLTQFAGSAESYGSFNDFFYRQLKPGMRPFDPAPGVVCSPADSRLLVYPRLQAGTCVPVKGVSFTLAELLRRSPDSVLGGRLAGGCLLIARLCPADYHRYHYPFAGRVGQSWRIPGRYHSVSPIALASGARPFAENVRIVTLLEADNGAGCAFIEVGAFGVAAIHQTHREPTFGKMDEKGYFAFGGSTIVLVFTAGAFLPDTDLLEHSTQGYETLVRAGEPIGLWAAAHR